MQEESLHVVIVASVPNKDQTETKNPIDTNEQNDGSSHEGVFQSSVDSPTFLKKQKKKLTESHVGYKIQEAKKESTGKFSLLRRLFISLATSTCFTFLLTMLMFIPLSKVIIGSIFFHECPAEPFIPVYLVVGGTVACARDLINIGMRSVLTDRAYFEYDVPITIAAFLYTMAEFAWFVYGSVFVYSLFNDFQWKDKSADNYCSSLLYMYAFVLTTMSYFLLVMTCILSAAAICVAYCLEFPGSQEQQPLATVVVVQPRGDQQIRTSEQHKYLPHHNQHQLPQQQHPDQQQPYQQQPYQQQQHQQG
ncbi:unnamed protein product [Candidula unifasciata]|uniref:Uncharacterized protein n=1 Tax=Candidula unifasciata TaxID=100452 RepID=A0A8S3YL78_9EUPU|nr:unnamed protein product [Candidula unifasciata]